MASRFSIHSFLIAVGGRMRVMQTELRIVQAVSPEMVEAARALFLEYAASLGVDLCFQNFEAELASLPGDYAPPHGRLLLAYWDKVQNEVRNENLAGCVALRQLDDTTCEMKRLYVRPAFRGKKIGHALALAVIAAAREIGYHRIRLDTLPSMAEAQSLYAALGFREISAYRHNPVPGSRFLELTIDNSPAGSNI